MIDLHITIDTLPTGAVDVRRTGHGLDPTEAESLLANTICNAAEEAARAAAIALAQPEPVCVTEGTKQA